MKTLGIIGGIAPESTIAYYRAIVALARERGAGYPPVLINSIDMPRMLGYVAAGGKESLAAYLLDELMKLVRAGAELALLASNTPHVAFDELRAASPIPLLSIVETAADAAATMHVRRAAILGTRFTMEGGVYPRVFAARGIAAFAPPPDDLELVHTRYVTELIEGRFDDATRDEILAVIDRLRDRDGADAVLLAGTELPLLLRCEEWHGTPLLDTGRLHVEAAVAAMLA